MPFKSEAQRRLFHAMEGRGEISPKKVEEWEDETPKEKKRRLPYHVADRRSEKKSSIDETYEAGVKQAMVDAGLLEKQAFIEPVLGAVAAPQGEGWRGASGAMLGSGLGGLAGLAGGGLLGAGLGAGIGGLAGGGKDAWRGAQLGGIAGGLLGTLGGGIYGGMKGYRAAILSPEERAALVQAKLREADVE